MDDRYIKHLLPIKFKLLPDNNIEQDIKFINIKNRINNIKKIFFLFQTHVGNAVFVYSPFLFIRN